ncbi:MAG: lipopolysaccharide core heptose(I) kinase RfaP [Victivallaceae bacterium]|nr:lipopolysaccharide core heptose(I) kinase RfaP [Victivallaceae bacterium]
MYELFLDQTFQKNWEGCDPFTEAECLDGEVFREVKTRRTFRFELDGNAYFAKIHRGTTWGEIFKNLFQLKLPVLGASNEYHAIRLLEKIGVNTMTPVAYGSRGVNPARIESFLITRELTDITSLEDYCRDWTSNPPLQATKRALIKEVSQMIFLMHNAGMNHRDCYLCHFMLKKSLIGHFPELYVIDLHRAQIRKNIPYRYRVKDVAGLFFSALDIGLTRRDILCFILFYGRMTPQFWEDVHKTAVDLYKKIHEKPPVETFLSNAS